MKLLIIDTETSGLPIRRGYDKYYPPKELDKYDSARLVQLGWILVEGGQEIASWSKLIKPRGYSPDVGTGKAIHKIDIEKLKDGVEIEDSFNDLIAVLGLHSPILVGHNLNFDLHIIQSEMIRVGFDGDVLSYPNKYCTMERSKYVTNLKSGRFYKSPTLAQLYFHYFKDTFPDAHTALGDCRATLACYLQLKGHQVNKIAKGQPLGPKGVCLL